MPDPFEPLQRLIDEGQTRLDEKTLNPDETARLMKAISGLRQITDQKRKRYEEEGRS